MVSSTTTYTPDGFDRPAITTYPDASTEVLSYDADGNVLTHQTRKGDTISFNVAAGTRATLVPDVQGSIIASLDSASGTLTKGGYQPYGEGAGVTATMAFGYTGARVGVGGLYDFRARFYAPGLGRFLQPDPIGTAGGANLYAYVGNDPLNLVDVFGLTPDSPSFQVAQTSRRRSRQEANTKRKNLRKMPTIIRSNKRRVSIQADSTSGKRICRVHLQIVD